MILRTVVVSAFILVSIFGFRSFSMGSTQANNLSVTVDSPNCSLAIVTVYVDGSYSSTLSYIGNCNFVGNVPIDIKVDIYVCIPATQQRGHETVFIKSDGGTEVVIPIESGLCDSQ
jgi:hypothetical protein